MKWAKLMKFTRSLRMGAKQRAFIGESYEVGEIDEIH